MKSVSLRTRLTVIILAPLLCISLVIGIWQFGDARRKAREIFDRSLLSTALAISRDVSLSGGDHISPKTRALIQDTSGGIVFYHVFAPDGAFVTGYASPPVAPGVHEPGADTPFWFDASYHDRPVRVVRLHDVAQIAGLSGIVTTTVWQGLDVRTRFVRDLTRRNLIVIASLIATVAFVAWFGVGAGLAPLLDLQQAIARRSPNDLAPIQRPVPREARGIVETLNALLAQVSAAMESQNTFISNAAHQLRNPIAGILAMAEAVQSAKSPDAMRKRVPELVEAAKHASHLANRLLTYERVVSLAPAEGHAPFDLVSAVAAAVRQSEPVADTDPAEPGTRRRIIPIRTDLPGRPVSIRGDATMVQEAISNVLDNALRHGGGGLTAIQVRLTTNEETARLTISDDGIGIPVSARNLVLERFGQLSPGEGSGLGLPIAAAVARQHNGWLSVDAAPRGSAITIALPLTG